MFENVSFHYLRRLLYGVVFASGALLVACGGGGGGSAPLSSTTVQLANAPTGPNVVPVTVRQLNVSGTSTANTPYVTVTVCDATGTCQTVPNVLVDTGSTGLRLFAAELGTLNLPSITAQSGGQLAACAQFASGFTWGSMRLATVALGGETTASAIPIQVIGDTAVPTVPAACSNNGVDFSQSLAGVVNGILGISNFQYDCGPACASSNQYNIYFGCNGSTCTPTTAQTSDQGTNPIVKFAQDNNGSILMLPAVPVDTGAAAALGVLVFGVGTQSNNALATGTQVYPLDASGNLSIAVNGQSLSCRTVSGTTTSSCGFIDSGSNGNFLALNLPVCKVSTGFYCPTSPVSVALQLSSGTASANAGITVGNADALFQTGYAALPAIAGSDIVPGQVDLGLPFFFGRPIATGIGIANSAYPNGFVAF